MKTYLNSLIVVAMLSSVSVYAAEPGYGQQQPAQQPPSGYGQQQPQQPQSDRGLSDDGGSLRAAPPAWQSQEQAPAWQTQPPGSYQQESQPPQNQPPGEQPPPDSTDLPN